MACLCIFPFNRDMVMNIVVTEGPAVQGIYQQVIRDFPSLIGSASIWESKRRYSCIQDKYITYNISVSAHQSQYLLFHSFSLNRRSGSCETIEDTLKPGWAKTIEGNWVTVVNTNAYPQEVKTVDCRYSFTTLLFFDELGFCKNLEK